MNDYLTLQQTAKILKVTDMTIMRWLYSKKIHGVKTANYNQAHWRIPKSEVRRILETQLLDIKDKLKKLK